jgi:hypothetical protein
MNLYKTTAEGLESTETKWAGSLAGASADRVALKKSTGSKAETVEVDVPTNKVGLLAFLNTISK